MFLPGQGPALAGQWGTSRLPFADFDVVPVDPVVAHFQRTDTGPLPLPLFHLEQVVSRAAGDLAQFIQLTVIVVGNDTSLANDHRRILHDRPLEQIDGVRVFVALLPELR